MDKKNNAQSEAPDFLTDEQMNQISPSDMDPQSAMAAQGFKTLGKAAAGAIDDGHAVPFQDPRRQERPLESPAIDPKKATSGNLSAALGAVGLGGAAAASTNGASANPFAQGGMVQHFAEGGMSNGGAPDFLTDEQMNQFNPGAESQPGVVNPALNQTARTPAAATDAPDFLTDEQMASQFPTHEETLQSQYGTPEQQFKAGLEGAAQGVLGPVAPAIETQVLGVDPEAIRKREEANPITHYGTQAGGLGLSMLGGMGFGSAAVKAGDAGLGALGVTSRIGSAATKAAIENMVISSGDELTKMVLGDPNSAQTALLDVGLSGILGGTVGGALGAVHPLWKETLGKETQTVLQSIADKAGGIEGAPVNSIEDAAMNSGMKLDPVVKAALSTDPASQHLFTTLQESATKTGIKAQTAFKQFKSDAADAVVNALGKTPEDISRLADISEYDTGESIKKSLAEQIKQTISPIAEQFEKIKSKYSKQEIPQLYKDQIADKVSNLATSEGYNLSPHFPQGKLINQLLEDLPNLKNLDNLTSYTSVIGDITHANPDLRRVGGQIKAILRSAEEDTVMSAAGQAAPDALLEHESARNGYREAMQSINDLNDRLHVGQYKGPDSFIRALKEVSPEDIVRRLSPKGDAGLITDLSSRFPEVAHNIRDYEMSKVLEKATKTASDGVINTKAFYKTLNDLSPEMRDFIIQTPEAASKLKSIQTLLDNIPDKMNSSGTAKTLDSLWSHTHGSAVAMIAMLFGHNPVMGYALGHLTKLLGRDIPDAVRYAMLKYLGSSAPVESAAFKKMADFMASTIKGEHLLNRASKNLFSGSTGAVIPATFTPSESDRKKLDKQLQAIQQSPAPLLDATGDLGHYMPEHAQVLSQTGSAAAAYLNGLRPGRTPSGGSFDAPLPPSKAAIQKYNRQLDIAQQPLMVLEHLKRGTLQPQDVTTLKTIYPALYNRMAAKMTEEITGSIAKGRPVPHKVQQSLSLFLGHPLTYSLTPQGIMGAQPQGAAAPEQQQQQQPPAKSGGGGGGSTKALQKFGQQYQTGSQAREQHRQAK